MSKTKLIKASDIHAKDYAGDSAYRKAYDDLEYKRCEPHILGLGDFTDADITAIEAARSPEAAKVFNSELK